MIIFYENVLITDFVHDNLRKGRRGEKKDQEQYSGGGGGAVTIYPISSLLSAAHDATYKRW